MDTEVTQSVTVWSRVLWPLVDAAQGLGFCVASCLAAQSLTEAELRDAGTRIALRKARGLIDGLIEVTQRRDLGLVAASELAQGQFDLFELALRSAPTLGQAVAKLEAVSGAFAIGLLVEVEYLPGFTRVRFGSPTADVVHPALVEFVMGALVFAARRETDPDRLRPKSVWFRHRTDLPSEPYTTLFAAPLVFGAPCDAITFEDALLHVPMRRANPRLHLEALDAIKAGTGHAGTGHAGTGHAGTGHAGTGSD